MPLTQNSSFDSVISPTVSSLENYLGGGGGGGGGVITGGCFVLVLMYSFIVTCRHWCVSTGKCLHTMTGHTASVNAVLISSDGSKTISGSSDTTVRVWNTDPASR